MDAGGPGYRERPTRVPAAVLWEATASPLGEPSRILPDGCLDIIWYGDMLLVAGPDRTAQLAPAPHGGRSTGLRFSSGTGPGVVGVPACELRDQRVPLADLWPAGTVRELTQRLAEAADPGRELERVVLDRLGQVCPAPDKPLLLIAERLRHGASVRDALHQVGFSERQLRRRCLAGFGYGSKTLARIFRLQRALAAARTGTAFATVATDAGYADQAHLSREVKALTGLPLGELIRP